MNNFVAGLLTMGFAVIGIFFFRFYRKVSDRFFLLFAVAFWVMSFERLVLVTANAESENYPLNYLLRFSAFFIIAIAIIDKNRKELS